MWYQPDFDMDFTLNTDASSYAHGAIPSQLDNEWNECVAYAISKNIEETQNNYSLTDKNYMRKRIFQNVFVW